MIDFLMPDAVRQKPKRCIEEYLSLSPHQSLTVGFYKQGRWYVMSNGDDPTALRYDIGSISKTITAHLILSLAEQGLIDLKASVSEYLDLPFGRYPTIYQLLTHTAGYGHLTPVEITIPSLLKSGYARRNIYEGRRNSDLLGCLARRKNTRAHGYSYSDFPFAVLAVVAEAVTGRGFSSLLEQFVQAELGMRDAAVSIKDELRSPPAMLGERSIGYWRWNNDNPFIAGGGLVCSVTDMLRYISVQIESDKPFITNAHRICEESLSERSNIATCIGWHTYKKSNQLWHVGGVGTFRSSIIINKSRRIGLIVLGNSKGVASANVHYLAKMLYSEMKMNKINFTRTKETPNGDK